MRKTTFLLIAALGFLIFSIPEASAAEPPSSLRLKTDFNIWTVRLDYMDWTDEEKTLFWNGLEVALPSDINETVRQSAIGLLHSDVKVDLNFEKVKAYLNAVVSPDIHRDKQDVVISLNESGQAAFDGFAISGQEVDFEKAYLLIKEAINSGEGEVRVPIKTIEPTVTVKSQKLIDKGITHLLSTGETDFSGSPANRRHNIAIGLNSFNGQLIAPEEESGAGKILGRIDDTTGYKKELVIKGDKTLPDYGGGLCQVSTTVYRSLLFAGLPITQRRNHSYAVSYYDPQGLDATIYPPYVDLKFLNDTPGHILIQTTTTDDDKAYSNIYGTPANRFVSLIGPYYYDHRAAPPDKVEYTDILEPGETKQVGGRHAGFKASWYRRITTEDSEDILEHIYSDYEARPNYTLIGEKKREPVTPSENGT